MSIPIPLATQAYEASSLPLAAQKLVNLYPEQAPEGSKAPVALFGTPGTTVVATVGDGPIRGSIVMGGVLYVVSNDTLYSLDSGWSSTSLGTITPTTRVDMAHNGTQIMMTCGDNGYIYSVAGGLVAITDEDYPGGNQVDFIDGYFIVTQDGEGTFWGSDLYDGTSWTATNFATAEGSPDNLVGQIVDHREIWLFGAETTEIWYNEGVNAFPFAKLGNIFIQRGCAARFSTAAMDNTVFWLGDDLIVYLADGYIPVRVSTHAIETAIKGYGLVSDAFAFTYTDGGHKFYVLTFPSASKTWCFDMATKSWHERQYYARNKVTNDWGLRHRANSYAKFNNAHVVGDFNDGRVYTLSTDVFSDGVSSGSQERITNGGFDSGASWVLTGSASIAGGLLVFGKVLGTAEQVSIFNNGSTYTITFSITISGNPFSVPDLHFYNGSGQDQLIATIDSAGSYEYEFTATSGSSDGSLYLYKEASADIGSIINVDDVSVLGSVAESDTIRRIWSSGVIQNQEKWSTMSALQVVFEQGTGIRTGQGSDPKVMMQYSDDGGKTWSTELWRGLGNIGKYKDRSIWRRLGKFRSRIFRWVVSDPVKVVVLQAYGE